MGPISFHSAPKAQCNLMLRNGSLGVVLIRFTACIMAGVIIHTVSEDYVPIITSARFSRALNIPRGEPAVHSQGDRSLTCGSTCPVEQAVGSDKNTKLRKERTSLVSFTVESMWSMILSLTVAIEL